MEQVLLWFFHSFSFLVESALSWKIIGDFSILHLIFGAVLLTTLLNLISFGTSNIGGTADYVGGIRRAANRENARDRELYASKTFENINHKTGEITRVTSRRLRE